MRPCLRLEDSIGASANFSLGTPAGEITGAIPWPPLRAPRAPLVRQPHREHGGTGEHGSVPDRILDLSSAFLDPGHASPSEPRAPCAASSGGLSVWCCGVRRVDTERHLQIAFPERDSVWRRRVARSSYMHLAREAAMTVRLSRMPPGEIVRRTEVVGFRGPYERRPPRAGVPS